MPLVFCPPGLPPSVHIAVYLPTAGQESRFLEELSNLSTVIDDILVIYPGALLYLRGDFNVSHTNVNRAALLDHFCTDHNLLKLSIPHNTYHHYLGDGQSDSNLDYILVSKSVPVKESLVKIHCKLSDPLVNSHHDLLVSTWSLPRQEPVLDDSSTNIVAPTVRNSHAKVIWTDEGIEEFQKFVSPHLSRIQQLWLNNPTGTSISLLLQSSSNVLTSFANSINKSIPLDGSRKLRGSSIPKAIRLSQNALKKLNKQVREAEENVSHWP